MMDAEGDQRIMFRKWTFNRSRMNELFPSISLGIFILCTIRQYARCTSISASIDLFVRETFTRKLRQNDPSDTRESENRDDEGEVIPVENSPFQFAQNTVRSSEIQLGSTSIEYRATNDFGGCSRRRGQFVCWERFRVFPKSFPSFVPGTSMKAESTYVLSNNQIDPLVECPFASYLSSSPYLESFPSHYSTPGRTAKSHESRRNTTVKLKWLKTP
ncbi:hypothetical protein G5I_08696 [Acromyrmex echinatior]|uniref:Uncharacterized protein n=1 Tax=Acromyrmex echinatior TaxID=103372 RepID=F4WS80_ACREC|nr:hypothetical protein G5I_08696 [Acromyrmex echinatior]